MSRTAIDQTSYDDASYYLPKGSNKNSHRIIESRGQSQKASEDLINPIFQFEMKFDSLKNYVDSVTTAVNQHASLLNKLRTEVNLRVVEKNLSESVNKFANCITVKDLDPNFMITAVHENIDSKNEEGSFQSSVTNFCNKLEIFSNGFSRVNKIGQTINGRMQEIENTLGKKISGADMKEKVKKTKTKIRAEMENNSKKLEEKIKVMEKRCLERYENLEKRMNRMDQNFEEGIKEQSSHQTIRKAELESFTREIQENIMKDISRTIIQNNESKHQDANELRLTIQAIEYATNKQLIDVKKAIQEVEASFAKKHEGLKQEDVEKEIRKHLAQGMKDFDRPFQESYNHIKQQIEELTKNIENINNGTYNSQFDNDNLKKLAEVEQATAKSQLEIHDLNKKINEIAKSLKEKLKLDEGDANPVNKFSNSVSGSISDLIQAEEEKHKKLSKTIEDLEQKVDKVNQNFDRKAAKLKKEFDIDALIKQFKSKADEGYVQKNFDNFEIKITGLSETFALLKREIDTISKGNYHSSKQNDSAFISIKSALPKACLSCGNNAPIHPINNSFGRPERAPLREKELSVDRPSTANNFKMKVITGSAMMANMNMTSTQGFGLTPLRITGNR